MTAVTTAQERFSSSVCAFRINAAANASAPVVHAFGPESPPVPTKPQQDCEKPRTGHQLAPSFAAPVLCGQSLAAGFFPRIVCIAVRHSFALIVSGHSVKKYCGFASDEGVNFDTQSSLAGGEGPGDGGEGPGDGGEGPGDEQLCAGGAGAGAGAGSVGSVALQGVVPAQHCPSTPLIFG